MLKKLTNDNIHQAVAESLYTIKCIDTIINTPNFVLKDNSMVNELIKTVEKWGGKVNKIFNSSTLSLQKIEWVSGWQSFFLKNNSFRIPGVESSSWEYYGNPPSGEPFWYNRFTGDSTSYDPTIEQKGYLDMEDKNSKRYADSIVDKKNILKKNHYFF